MKQNWSEPYRETRFDGKIFQLRKRVCDCDCHKPGKAIMHFMACCNDGWVYQRKIVQPLGTLKPVFQLIVPRDIKQFDILNPKIDYKNITESSYDSSNPKVFHWYE